MECDGTEDEYDIGELQVLIPDEILWYGLELVGYTERHIKRVGLKRNIERFKAHYGANHVVCAMIWEDFQRINAPDAQVPPENFSIDSPENLSIDYLLPHGHALSEKVEPIFDVSPET